MSEKNLKISFLLDFYGDILTEKQRDSLELYYNEDLSLAEIAEHTKITRQGVRDNIKRGEAILIEMEEKLGFYEKYFDLDDKMNDIYNAVSNIYDVNLHRYNNSDIKKFCEEIEQITQKYR